MRVRTWYIGSFTNIDVNGDGTATETVNFALTDTDSDGEYETMDISVDGAGYGDISGLGASLTDNIATTNNDERISLASPSPYYVALGTHTFEVEFRDYPATAAVDARIRSATWYTGKFTIDLDADANADNDVDFALTDTDSDGLYDTMDVSVDGAGWGDISGLGASLGNNIATTNDDERFSWVLVPPGSWPDILLGSYYTFTFEFDQNPPNDDDDARIYSKTWYTGDFTIDADGDEVADNTMYFALSDKNSDGLYDSIDMSISDDDFGETGSGNLSDNLVNYLDDSNNDNDELDSWNAGGNLAVLGTHWFLVEFDKNPPYPGNTDDASITARWYVGTFNADIDGDQIDEILDYVYVDPNSNGLFTIINLDCNDSGKYTASSPDEELLSGDMADLDGQLTQITFPMNPQNSPYTILTDGRIITVTRRNATQWLLKVPASADVGGVQDQIEIKIAHPDDEDPGFYQISGVIAPKD